jgi:hypothetical protein
MNILFYIYFAGYFNADDCPILVFPNQAEAHHIVNEQFAADVQ